MPTFVVEDEIRGTMTYRYEIEADTEEEARELFIEGYFNRELDSDFVADSDGSIGISIKKKGSEIEEED